MKFLPFTKLRNFIIIAAFLILAGGIGYRLGERRATLSLSPTGRILLNTTPPPGTPVDFSLFWDVWQRLQVSYIEAHSIDPQQMVYGAISGMVGSLGDPYTAFFPPKENAQFKEDLGGQFEGIGAELGLKDNRVVVVTPLKGTPADKAGLKPVDAILKVGEEDATGWSVQQAVDKIRGPKGTTVKLTVLHLNSVTPVTLSITRDTIVVPSVNWWIKSPGEITEISGVGGISTLLTSSRKVAYLDLSRFGDHTNEDWLKAVGEITKYESANGPLAGLIFDLRNNPGGYLEGSVFIASEFIKSGTVVTQVNSDGSRQDYQVDRKGSLLDIPLIILVNKGSASAAEIVAGALKDYKRGTLVGETTFGKGSVQTPEDLAGGAGLHITTGKWLLPKGAWINKLGVKPDVEVVLDDNASIATQDAQLARAVQLLLK